MSSARDDRVFTWSNRWFRLSVIWLVLLTVFSVLVGFVVLPSVHGDYTAQGLWASICRAAGVPSSWVPSLKGDSAAHSTNVVLVPAMGRAGASDAIGRGATLALNCTMCHGAQGASSSDAPNLAGQYPEVIIKQLLDYKSGRRAHSLMEQLARALSEKDINELAVYYASLPKARTAPTTYDESLPALIRVGPTPQHRALHFMPRRCRPEAGRALARRNAEGVSGRADRGVPQGHARERSAGADAQHGADDQRK